MYIHNLDPILFDFGFFTIRWYSLAYIFGILIGWWLGKKIIYLKFNNSNFKFDIKEFDNLITYLIISMIVGGRLGYILFYNFRDLFFCFKKKYKTFFITRCYSLRSSYWNFLWSNSKFYQWRVNRQTNKHISRSGFSQD